MKTGEPVPRTGLYGSGCSCQSQVLSRFGEIAPPCWKCRAHVTWTFLRVSFAPDHGPDGSATPASEVEVPPERSEPSASRRPRALLVASERGVVERALRQLAGVPAGVVNLEVAATLVGALRA